MLAESESPAVARWMRMEGGIKEMLLVSVGSEVMFKGIKNR